MLPSEESCLFCRRKVRVSEMPVMIQKMLYRLHCSSLNYYYTKDLNKLIMNQRSSAAVTFKESMLMSSKEECLAQYYPISTFKTKRPKVKSRI